MLVYHYALKYTLGITFAMFTIDSFAFGIAPLGDNVLLMFAFPISAAMFTIDSFACGIAPLGGNILLLTFEKDGDENEVKVFI